MLALKAQPMAPEPYRIDSVRRETEDTFTLNFRPTSGDASAPFSPGQFNMLYVFGVGEAAISISGDPANSDTLIHTVRAVGTVTKALTSLRAGSIIGVRGPFGTPWPVDQARGRDVVIIAGGIGLAPLRPVVYHLLANREQFGRVVLLYGARTPQDILYPDDLKLWRGRFDTNVRLTVDRASEDWRGQVGVVTTLVPQAPFDPNKTVAFVCGPEIMMTFAIEALRNRGVADERMYVSMERNMKCAIGFCGHCQFGPTFICKEGPVYRLDRVRRLMSIREI